MARTPNEEYRQEKESRILESARIVFCRKGYLNVTMQDIIDECNISRGGIYLYFSSVDEIFQAVSSSRSRSRSSVTHKSIDDNEPFAVVLDAFLASQKERLLHMENSLLRASYEYIFSGAKGATPAFRNAQLANLRKTVLSILTLGIEQKVIKAENTAKLADHFIVIDENMAKLADHFIVIIEGLGVMALVDVLTEKIVDEQFAILNTMIEKIKY